MKRIKCSKCKTPIIDISELIKDEIKKAKEEEREMILGMIEEEVIKDGRVWLFHHLKEKLKEGKE